MEYETLAAAVAKACEEEKNHLFTVWSPVADGEYFVGNPLHTGFRKETKHIPVLIGSCVCEFLPSPGGQKRKLDGGTEESGGKGALWRGNRGGDESVCGSLSGTGSLLCGSCGS